MDKLILASEQIHPRLTPPLSKGEGDEIQISPERGDLEGASAAPCIAIAGGVSANSGLRKALTETGKKLGWRTFIPPFEYCTDNAAMIAIAGHYKYLKGEFASQNVAASARYTI
jgi:tRNA A37 threonylcarbamoyltransferase TsaD